MRACSNRRFYPNICLEGRAKIRKHHRTFGVSHMILTKHVARATRKSYWMNQSTRC